MFATTFYTQLSQAERTVEVEEIEIEIIKTKSYSEKWTGEKEDKGNKEQH